MITVRGPARRFTVRGQTVEAVKGVDFDVAPGEVVGFLGPNGAGKTTTLRMLTTLLRPTGGTGTVAGCDLLAGPQGVRRRIGCVHQGGATWPESRAGEEIELQARLYGLSRTGARRRGALLADRLDLAGLDQRPVKTLSGGQRRRLDIALGPVHDPMPVFLDEPTAGLDPQSRANLWDHVRSLRSEQGATVFLTTHHLDEADVLCDRILVTDHGTIVAEGTSDRLRHLADVGLGYLSLDRRTRTLSGGESQRIKTVRHLSSSLTEMLYVFDEPSIGLHPRDVHRLRTPRRVAGQGQYGARGRARPRRS